MLPLPWQTVKKPGSQQECVVVLTRILLRRFRDIPSFLWHTFAVQRELRRIPGAIGYSLFTILLKREFWTVSVWENEESIAAFVKTSPHVQLSKNAGRYFERSNMRMARWKIKGEALPLKWPELLTRFHS